MVLALCDEYSISRLVNGRVCGALVQFWLLSTHTVNLEIFRCKNIFVVDSGYEN